MTDLPARIGDLVVDGLLGEGGMGRVYLCTDHALAREIAVKTLQPNLLSDSTMRERFVREARALARVKSAHVVTVHAIGEDAVVGPFVVMERLIGEDLLQRLHRRERLPVDEVIILARAAAQGLAHAHDAGVVHRDIKPANLFCKRESAAEGAGEHLVITDFGLAKEVGGAAAASSGTSSGGALIPASQLTQADVIVGTPAYLAPELARGQAASPSSDLYALGATLFHLLVGDPPFVADSTIEVITKAVLETAPRASSLVADVPLELDTLLAQLLEKRPEDRPQSAAVVVATLSTMGSGAINAFGTPSRPYAPPVIASIFASHAGSTQMMGSIGTQRSSSSSTALTPPTPGAPTTTAPTPSPSPTATPSPTDDTVPSLLRSQLPAHVSATMPLPVHPSSSSLTEPATTSSFMERRFFNRERLGDIGAALTERPKLWAAATAGACLLLALGLASVVGSGRRERIEAEPAAVQAEIEKIDDKKSNDLVDLGLAQWTQDQRKAAFSTWRLAVKAGADDPVMLTNAFAAFDAKDDKGAEKLLVEWQGPIEPGLRETLASESWWPRHHALSVLEARNTATDDDRHVVALKDVQNNDCNSRRYGVLALKRFGKGLEAMQAIKRLQNNLAMNLCMVGDLKNAEDAIRRRTNATDK